MLLINADAIEKGRFTMPEIDASDFLEELRFDIREQDMIKAKLVLSKIGAIDDSVRKMALFEVKRADDTFAIPLIVNLIADHRELARTYPQIKEILYAKSLYHPDLLLSMLARENKRENRVVLVDVAGEIRLEGRPPNSSEFSTKTRRSRSSRP